MDNVLEIRRKNRIIVRDYFQSAFQNNGVEYVTKPELARGTGLSLVTAGAIISDMVKDGEVIGGGPVPSGGGRPSLSFRYNPEYRCAASAYMFSDGVKNRVRFSVFDFWGTELHTEIPEAEDNYTYTFFEIHFDVLLDQFPAVRVLTLAFPGVESPNGPIGEAAGPQLLLAYLRKRYTIPVLFENDINTAIFGWYEKHCWSQPPITKNSTVVGLYFPGTMPPGAGIIVNGALYHGKNSFAGEFARIPASMAWEDLDYGNERQLVEMVGNAVILFCCTFAPDQIVLYGSFWTDTLRKGLHDHIGQYLGGHFLVDLTYMTNIDADFRSGVIALGIWELRKMYGVEKGDLYDDK